MSGVLRPVGRISNSDWFVNSAYENFFFVLQSEFCGQRITKMFFFLIDNRYETIHEPVGIERSSHRVKNTMHFSNLMKCTVHRRSNL